ncbi:hypothetical protein CASFOL_002728 [Castilleja foliolosa]|uniref:Replication protein A 70 kDa DNA-binding subunit B/D first OB fold domain-containing protein n=1 Tax=Castilleja foliolosa TaxID=1961234 RepID=A0ABD3EH27_9LAMI
MTSSYSVSSSVYVNISDLEPGKSELGLKMILHDEIEDRIHATIDFGVFKSKKIDIIEGGLYRIKLFMVAHDMTKYKSTTNRFKLRLTNQTSICAFQDPDFPSSMYKFRDLFEISNDISVDNFQLLDVIGRVVSFQKPTYVPKLSTKRMDFRIADTDFFMALSSSAFGGEIGKHFGFEIKRCNEAEIRCSISATWWSDWWLRKMVTGSGDGVWGSRWLSDGRSGGSQGCAPE